MRVSWTDHEMGKMPNSAFFPSQPRTENVFLVFNSTYDGQKKEDRFQASHIHYKETAARLLFRIDVWGTGGLRRSKRPMTSSSDPPSGPVLGVREPPGNP